MYTLYIQLFLFEERNGYAMWIVNVSRVTIHCFWKNMLLLNFLNVIF